MRYSTRVDIIICSHAQVFEAADETLKEEDAVKERLCNELNMLVQQSAHAQLEKLEQVWHCSICVAADWPQTQWLPWTPALICREGSCCRGR